MCSGSLSGLDTGMKACCPVKPFVGGSRVCDTQADTWENGGLKEGAKTLEKIGGAEGDRTLGLMTASQSTPGGRGDFRWMARNRHTGMPHDEADARR